MKWIADTHVHVYPGYELARFFDALARNARRLGEGEILACLTERSDGRFYRDLREGRLRLPAGYRCEPGSSGIRIAGPEDSAWWLIPGRQVATRERLELLGLGVDAPLPDGELLQDAWQRIRDELGLPVAPWSPGKWTGRRGRLLRELIEHAEPGALGVGDSLMRPSGWPEPALFRLARRRGLPVLAGSDPLPLAGEERFAGRYGTAFEAGDNLDAALRRLRFLKPGQARAVGARLSAWQVARRWWALRGA